MTYFIEFAGELISEKFGGNVVKLYAADPLNVCVKSLLLQYDSHILDAWN